MNRGRPEFKKSVRVSLVLEQEHFECVKKAALQLSAKEGRIITPSEVMRLALNKCYPMSENADRENDLLDSCKAC